MPDNLPDFIIIGAMKSATSTLHEQLQLQSGIFMCTPKEPNFFSDDPNYARGMAWYQGLFSDAGENSLKGESSTHYTKLPTYPHTIERLQRAGIPPRFIYIMRHPVDRLVSHYIHEWTQGVIKADIVSALENHPELVQYGQYAMQLEPYFDAFGQEAVLPVFFDRIRSKPQAELERICRFIGYPGKPCWRTDLKPTNVSRERIRRFPFDELLIYSAPATWLRRTLFPKALRKRVRQRLTMRKRPQLPAAVKAEVEAVFNEDLAMLGKWLGVDVNCDNFSEVTRAGGLEWRV